MIVKGRFLRGNRQQSARHLTAHFRYLEHRSRDELRESTEDRRLFDKNRDQVDRDEATSDVMSHTSTSVNYHKLVLSPGSDEPVDDYRQWTREVMRDLQEHQGKELHWYASIHANTDNPHVHVVLAGAGEHLETCEQEPVTLYKEDYEQLRESALDHSDRDWYQQISDYLHEFNERDTVVHDRETQDQERDLHREPVTTFDQHEGEDYER